LQGYGIDAFREDEKKFLISAGAGAAKVRSVVLMHRLGRKRFTGEIEIAAFDFFFKICCLRRVDVGDGHEVCR